MKHLRNTIAALLICIAFLACSSNRYKGSAADRTGTNGATTGTGKVP